MATDEPTTDHNGLYKQPASPYWYFQITLNGRRYRRTTKCTDLETATRIRNEFRRRLLLASLNDEWQSFVTSNDKWIRELWQGARRRGKANGKGCTLTKDQVREIALRSGGNCEVTGIAFSDAGLEGTRKRPLRASLDRIDSSQGYTLDNCRLVCVAVNLMMNAWGEDVVYLIARSLIYKELARTLGYEPRA